MKRLLEVSGIKGPHGEMPLDYMIRIMRDPSVPDQRRDFMASRAAPYCHPTFASVKVTNPLLPIEQLMAGMNDEQLAAVERFIQVLTSIQPDRPQLGFGPGAGTTGG
jgi:hypothetical protein